MFTSFFFLLFRELFIYMRKYDKINSQRKEEFIMDDKEFLLKIKEAFEKDKIKLSDKEVDYGQKDFNLMCSQWMTMLETHFHIPFLQDEFEKYVEGDVKELYVAIASARDFSVYDR